jgi:hypothetical protein
MHGSFEALDTSAAAAPARVARASSVPATARPPDRCETPNAAAASTVAGARFGGEGHATAAPRPGSLGARSAPAGEAGPLAIRRKGFPRQRTDRRHAGLLKALREHVECAGDRRAGSL